MVVHTKWLLTYVEAHPPPWNNTINNCTKQQHLPYIFLKATKDPSSKAFAVPAQITPKRSLRVETFELRENLKKMSRIFCNILLWNILRLPWLLKVSSATFVPSLLLPVLLDWLEITTWQKAVVVCVGSNSSSNSSRAYNSSLQLCLWWWLRLRLRLRIQYHQCQLWMCMNLYPQRIFSL